MKNFGGKKKTLYLKLYTFDINNYEPLWQLPWTELSLVDLNLLGDLSVLLKQDAPTSKMVHGQMKDTFHHFPLSMSKG